MTESLFAALDELIEAMLDEPGLRLSPRLADALEQAEDARRAERGYQRRMEAMRDGY